MTNRDDFELSDDSECEYEVDRRLRRLQASHHHCEGSDRIDQQESVALFTSNNIPTTLFSAIEDLNYDDGHSTSWRRCDLNQIVGSISHELDLQNVKDREWNLSATVFCITSKIFYFLRKIKKKTRLELWLIIPCIMTLLLALSSNSPSSDNFMILNRESGLQNYNTGKTWIENERLGDIFDYYYHEQYAMIADLYTPMGENDIPLLWSIPFGGTDVLEEIITKCYGSKTITNLEVLTNVNSINDLDIKAGKVTVQNIHQSNQNAILMSSSISVVSSFFTEENPGRPFTIIRNPVHRTVDQYYDEYRKAASRVAFVGNDDAALLSLAEYVSSPGSSGQSHFVDNWLVRSLNNLLAPIGRQDKLSNLGQIHLEYAKKILRLKCLVGFFDEMEEFLNWMDLFFHWGNDSEDKSRLSSQLQEIKSYGNSPDKKDTNMNKVERCRNPILEDEIINRLATSRTNRYPIAGTDLYNTLLAKNKWDMELYLYAKESLYNDELGMINFILQRQRRPLPDNVEGNKEENV